MADTLNREEYVVEFQTELDQLNADDPVMHDVPHFLSIFRHVCPIVKKSKAIDTKEIYWVSEDKQAAFTFREGKCPKCGQRARSREGNVVDPRVRPPITGRVARD